MEQTPLTIKASLQVRKTPAEVFQAIVDPQQMSNYFISEGSAALASGTTVQWKFPEFDMRFDIRVANVRSNEYISFFWDGQDQREHLVEISLKARGDSSTVVSVIENGGLNSEEGIAWLKSNTEGWANFLACLKAWLEYGVHLREGAFDFMNDPK